MSFIQAPLAHQLWVLGAVITCVMLRPSTFYTLVIQHSNEKWTRIEDVFPIKNGDIPASYVSLPEGILFYIAFLEVSETERKCAPVNYKNGTSSICRCIGYCWFLGVSKKP